MNLLRDILGELGGMFVADLRLSGAVIVLVAVAAFLIDVNGLDPVIGGIGLLLGSLMTLAVITAAEARRRQRK